jgi:hypothetical protein
MKIFLALVSLLGGQAFAGADFASSADCVLFLGDAAAPRVEKRASEEDNAVDELSSQETAAIGLAWVREGAVLDTYNVKRYRGEQSTYAFDSYDPRYEHAAGGAFVHLNAFGNAADRAVASFRCRPLGDELPRSPLAPYAKLRSLGGRLTWLSGGNHPDNKWVELSQESGLHRLKVHTDHTYGINRVDWVLELDSGRLVKTSKLDGPRPTKVEEFSAVTEAWAFVEELKAMEEVASVIQPGVDYGYFVLPPKPELRLVLEFLRSAQFLALHPAG